MMRAFRTSPPRNVMPWVFRSASTSIRACIPSRWTRGIGMGFRRRRPRRWRDRAVHAQQPLADVPDVGFELAPEIVRAIVTHDALLTVGQRHLAVAPLPSSD